MGFFDSILPPAAPPAATTPAGILSLLPGLPGTQRLAQHLAAAPAAAPAAGAPALPGVPALPGPAPMSAGTPPPAMPDFGSLLPDPTRTGFDAAAQAASNTPAESNPLNTLAISLAHGVSAGLPAFRAQRQVNKEAEYAQAVQQAKEQDLNDFVNDPTNWKPFGTSGAQLQTAAKAMLKTGDTQGVSKLLQDHNLYAPPEIVPFGENGTGLYNKSSGTVVRQPTTKLGEGDTAYQTAPDGTVAKDANGQPIPLFTNPKPVPASIDKMSPGMIDAGIGLGYNDDAKQWTAAQRAAAYALDPENPANKIRAARAGAAAPADVVGAEVNKRILTDVATAAPTIRRDVSEMGDLQQAVKLLKSGNVNTGLGANVLQGWSRMTDAGKAAATQQYLNLVGPTVLSGIKGQLGTGASMRITQNEITGFMKYFGGDITQLPAALESTLTNRIDRLREGAVAHDANVTAFASDNPKSARAILQQYAVPIPASGPTPPATPPGVTQSVKNGRKGYVDPTTGAFVYQEGPK